MTEKDSATFVSQEIQTSDYCMDESDSTTDDGTNEKGIYDRTVDEQIKDLWVFCGVHGELDVEDISVGFDGGLHCEFCSLNQEMDTQNELDIDSSVEIELPSTRGDTDRTWEDD